MFHGLYAGASALENLEKQHLVTSTNLAHVNTTGFRKGMSVTYQKNLDFGDQLSVPGSRTRALVDFKSQGVMEATHRNLDLAISGEGFFQFEGENETVYSKNGSLLLSENNQLTNLNGLPILGVDGPINVPAGVAALQIQISEDGTVWADDQNLGQIELVEFEDPQKLQSDSQVYFLRGEATEKPETDSRIMSGRREMSNANPVEELVNLILTTRQLEAAQRAIRSISDSIEKAVRD